MATSNKFQPHHIKLGSVSLCQDRRCHTVKLAQKIQKAGLHMVCSGSKEECAERVKWLKRNGFKEAEVVKGNCTQWIHIKSM